MNDSSLARKLARCAREIEAARVPNKAAQMAAFEKGNRHIVSLPGHGPIYVYEADCRQIKGAAQDNERAPGSVPNAADEPVAAPPKFKVGDFVMMKADKHPVLAKKYGRCEVTHIAGSVLVFTTSSDEVTWTSPHNLVHAPPPVPVDEWKPMTLEAPDLAPHTFDIRAGAVYHASMNPCSLHDYLRGKVLWACSPEYREVRK